VEVALPFEISVATVRWSAGQLNSMLDGAKIIDLQVPEGYRR